MARIENMKPVIFLDCDGVLNCQSDFEDIGRSDYDGYPINPACLARMEKFAASVDADVVISSSWRTANSPEFMRKKLGASLGSRLHEAWRTDSIGLRGDEVEWWLAVHGRKHRPYVIFDDDSDFHPKQPLVKTSWALGVQDSDIRKAVEIVRKHSA